LGFRIESIQPALVRGGLHYSGARGWHFTKLLGAQLDESTISELRAQYDKAVESLQKAEIRATAGQLGLEVMHEIRNPLEALGHLVYLAHEQAEEPGEVRKYMKLAEEQVATLAHISHQTLAFARSSAAIKPVNLVALAEAALRIHQRTIEAKKIRLVRELPVELVADIHTTEILQVVSNVIHNALDALPAEGILRLRLRKRPGELEFVIADNGHGIPKESLAEVFEPFFTTKEEGGTGLGLALSKNIVDLHRGKIRVRSSVRPGKSGTIFKISLPDKKVRPF
jgi:signal transduction histidine kinase